MDSIENILLELSLMVTSFAIQFFLPGFGGLLLSGLVSFATTIGIQISHNNLTQNPMFYITRLLGLFMPQAKNLILSHTPKLAKISQFVDKTSSILGKIQNLFIDDFVKALNDPKNQFKSNGLTQNIEEDIQKIEVQNKVQDALGKDIVKIQPIYRYVPNAKKPDSWIMAVEFQEIIRFGKKIVGDMTITYCFENRFRVGYRWIPIKDKEIRFGRTSQGKINASDESNAEYYDKRPNIIDKTRYKIRRVTFNNCSFYGDFLPFLRSYSWGGYYMRKWMIGMPGSVEAIVAPLIFFGSLSRLYTRITALIKMGKKIVKEPGLFFSNKAQEFGTKLALKSRIGTRMKLAEMTKVFSKTNELYQNYEVFTYNQFKNKAKKIRQKALRNRRKRKGYL